MAEAVKKYRLYAGFIQDIPQGVKYSCIPSHHQYLLVYTDIPLAEKDGFILQDENAEMSLNREEKLWLAACKLDVNTQVMREREKEYSSVLMDYFDMVEGILKEKRQKETEKENDVKQQEAGDDRETDN